MKRSVVITLSHILLIISLNSLCHASNLTCLIIDKSVKNSLEKYCDRSIEQVSKNCSDTIEPVNFAEVCQLKIRGCDNNSVLSAVKRSQNIRDLDISYSAYEQLNWFDSKLDQLQKFNASHNQIQNLPLRFLKNAVEIREIDLSFNQLEEIPSNVFSGLKNLATIHLSNNLLKEIAHEAFESALKHIDLSNNNLWILPEFANHNQLQRINLEWNPISSFHCSRIATQHSVSVRLTWKYLTSFDSRFDCPKQFQVHRNGANEGVFPAADGMYEIHCNDESFQQLDRFMIGRNTFVNVSDMIAVFGASLKHLDVSENFVGQLNAINVEKLVNLTHLYMRNTMLREFDFGVIKNPEQLQTLDISGNNLAKRLKNAAFLEKFNLDIFKVAENQLENTLELIQNLKKSVQHLDLSGNFVGKLNKTSFEHLIALKTLNLSDTNLAIFSENPFETLKNLTLLDISRNNLETLNLTMVATTLNKLNHFGAANCRIKNASEVFEHLRPSVIKLDLSGNSIEALNAETFKRLTNLEYLNLSNTNLSNFDMKMLQQHENLQILDISLNKLQEIDFTSYATNNYLQRLNLDGNNLTKIHNLVHSHFPWLGMLTISKNRLSCNDLKRLSRDWATIFTHDSMVQKHKNTCHLDIKAKILIVVGAIIVITFVSLLLCIYIDRPPKRETILEQDTLKYKLIK